MKRSDVVTIIAESLVEPHSDDVFEEASHILKRLERLGMSPPEYKFWNSKNPNDLNENGVPKDLEYDPHNGEYRSSWEDEE